MCVYDTDNHYYLQVTWDEEKGRVSGSRASSTARHVSVAPLPLEGSRLSARSGRPRPPAVLPFHGWKRLAQVRPGT
jgi:hypothetical protein